MAINYDFYHTPSPNKEGKQSKLHPRVVSGGTVDTDKLARSIEHASSLTEGDAKAALHALCHAITDELQAGNRVHLDGLGYFYLTLTAPPIESEKEIRAESVKVKSIAFLPESNLKKQFSNVEIRRTKRKNHSQMLSDSELDGILTDYFKDNPYINRKTLQEICGFTKSMASKRIQKLIEDGKLTVSAYSRQLYEWHQKDLFI